MTTLKDGGTYTTRDGRTVSVVKMATGNFFSTDPKRFFTPAGGCIAYYRGEEPIIEDTKSIVLPRDPEADIVDEIHADEAKAQDPHTWTPAGKQSTGHGNSVTCEYWWCRDCGSLKLKTTVMHGAAGISETAITTPREYHTCGKKRRRV